MDNLKIVNREGIPSLSYQKRREEIRDPASGFYKVIKKAVSYVDEMEDQANSAIRGLAMGTKGIHETMIAIQKADLSMRLLLQIRNKVLEAYREIMHMTL